MSQPRQLCVVGHDAIVDELFEPDRQGYELRQKRLKSVAPSFKISRSPISVELTARFPDADSGGTDESGY